MMPISNEQYQEIAQHIIDNCTISEVNTILEGDFSPLRTLILEELLLVDYRGSIIDIIFEDLFTQKKKPFLRKELNHLADFLLSDLSLYYLKQHLLRLKK